MAVIYADDFSDANGTDLSGKALDTGANTWTEHNGAWTTESGRAQQATTGGAQYSVTVDTGDADVVITLDAVAPSGAYAAGVMARATDHNNGWLCLIEDDGGTEYLVIIERNGGSNTQRATTNCPGLSGTTVTLTVTCSGNTITLASNGGFSCQYTSATFQNTATRHGLTMFRNGSYEQVPLDNFSVDDAAVGAAGHPAARRLGLAAGCRPVEIGRVGVLVA